MMDPLCMVRYCPTYKIKPEYAAREFPNIKSFGPAFLMALRQDTFHRNTDNEYYLPSDLGRIYAIPDHMMERMT